MLSSTSCDSLIAASEYCGRVRSIEAEPAVGHTECFVELESWPMAAEGLYKPDTTENDWREAQPFWPLLQKLEAAHFRPAPFSGTGIQLTHAGQERVSAHLSRGRCTSSEYTPHTASMTLQ